MPLGTNREAIGPYWTDTVEFSFDSGASAGDLGARDIDATVIVPTYEAPFAGWVAWISVNAVGGSFSAAVFLVQVETTADADSSFNPGAAATGYTSFAPSKVPFAAGNSLAVEIDSYTTFRDCTVKLGLVYDTSAI